ncbi:hypothetical protein AB0383_20725 [Amycolatopsis sp. NPDC051373]|uniref:hypothetical protein n=1 Tax=Amycolatopsis sp. NPDC051373 TaxID=3155801 RepID=UPI00344BAC48
MKIVTASVSAAASGGGTDQPQQEANFVQTPGRCAVTPTGTATGSPIHTSGPAASDTQAVQLTQREQRELLAAIDSADAVTYGITMTIGMILQNVNNRIPLTLREFKDLEQRIGRLHDALLGCKVLVRANE